MSTQTDDPIGRIFAGRYQILTLLGNESVGRVWSARDRFTGGLVQVKVLQPQPGEDPLQWHERFARFAREIKASFMVTHPNTVEVTDYGDQDGMHYLVLEYLACRTLEAELRAGTMPVARAAAIASQVTHAIGAAHQERIVHRALSPENVVLLDNVAPDGPVADAVKVRDFGLSKLEDADAPELTANEIRVGAEAYMAPEYIDSGVFHPKGDLYAVGALLFRMIAGRPPFEGERDVLLSHHVTTPAPRLATVVHEVPAWIDQLVADLLGKDPEQRPGTHAVITRLEDGVGHPLVAPPLVPLDPDGKPIRVVAPPTPPAPEGVPGRLPERVIQWAALIVVGVLGTVVVASAIAVAALVLSLPS